MEVSSLFQLSNASLYRLTWPHRCLIKNMLVTGDLTADIQRDDPSTARWQLKPTCTIAKDGLGWLEAIRNDILDCLLCCQANICPICSTLTIGLTTLPRENGRMYLLYTSTSRVLKEAYSNRSKIHKEIVYVDGFNRYHHSKCMERWNDISQQITITQKANARPK